jgi:hypothetical protein
MILRPQTSMSLTACSCMPPLDDSVRSLVFCCVTLMGAVSPWWCLPQKTLEHLAYEFYTLIPTLNVTGWLSCLQFNTGETMAFNVAVVCLDSFCD